MRKKVETRKYSDRREYLSKMTTVRRLRIKKMLVESKGGKCQICGYSRCLVALDFHHIDESTKLFGLSQRGLIHSWEKMAAEARKCVLVCANCHREIHAGLIDISKLGNPLV
ncbi:HNH endonuclease [Candidatus Woesebacteria bacterium]|nr:HNH endonuclease [Candidatus Woesebacteria bacterium]